VVRESVFSAATRCWTVRPESHRKCSAFGVVVFMWSRRDHRSFPNTSAAFAATPSSRNAATAAMRSASSDLSVISWMIEFRRDCRWKEERFRTARRVCESSGSSRAATSRVRNVWLSPTVGFELLRFASSFQCRLTSRITCGTRRARALRAAVRVTFWKEISKARDRPERRVHRVVMRPHPGKKTPRTRSLPRLG
jgi:hypothetical protein